MRAIYLLTGLEDSPKPSVEDLTDEKQRKYIGIITEKFKLQPSHSSCETTCITNIIHELADRFRNPSLHISEARINFLCGNKYPKGYTPQKVIPSLRKELHPLGWTIDQKSDMSHRKLHDILVNLGCSYPMVGLSYEYMQEELDYRAGNDSDHTVIVFRAVGDWTVLYDPYKSLVPIARRKYQAYGDGIIPIRTTKFINYWKYARIQKSWILWASKLAKPQPLESYSEQQEALVIR